ncbi:MAG: glycosyltransferase family 1 protein [Burkholderiales bacterium]
MTSAHHAQGQADREQTDAAAPARRLRMTVVTETWPPEVNGVASTLARFVDGLAARGHSVTLLRPRQDRDPDTDQTLSGRGYPEILIRGVRIPRYPDLRMGLPARRAMQRLWRAQPPDLVHIATEGPLGWSALRSALQLGLPVSTDFRTNFDAYSAHYGIGWLRRPILGYLRRFHNRAALTMVPTRAMLERLRQQGFERLQVVGRGIDTALFTPARRDPALRQRWGAGPDTPVVLHVGRMAPEKNPDALGAAFEAMRARAPRARLVLVGDGPARARMQARFPDAIFAGMRGGTDLAAHYASADVFLFPSETETFGNVTLEAMASGLAIVAYDYAAAAEHVVHGRSGLLAPLGDTAALVALAAALAGDMAQVRALGAQARADAQALHWDRLVHSLETELLRVADAALPRAPESGAQPAQGGPGRGLLRRARAPRQARGWAD